MAPAQFALGGLDDLHGKTAEALKWYRLAAAQGDAQAQSNVGHMYETGRGVAQSYGDAAPWYRRAADQGLATAQYNLGVLYDNGHGVSRDYQEAAKWYRLAAAQGDADAQYSLGILYDDGNGVPHDDTEAAKVVSPFRRPGRRRRRTISALCTRKAMACRKMYVQAYMWFALSAEQDNSPSRSTILRSAADLTDARANRRRPRIWRAQWKPKPRNNAREFLCGGPSRKSTTPNP